MKEVINLDDILKTVNCNYKLNLEEQARVIFEAYDAFTNRGDRSISSVAREWGVCYQTMYSWQKHTPPFIKQIKALEQRDLLPLKDDSSYFNLFQELFLHTLFSGCIYNYKGGDSYELSLVNEKDSLSNIGEALSALDLKHKPLKLYNNGYELKFGSSKKFDDPIAQGICRLLISAGVPVGAKYKAVINYPSFIDDDLLVYYAFKLRGVYNNVFEQARINLWTTNKVNAERTLRVFLSNLNKTSLHFTGTIRPNTSKVYDGLLDEGFYPQLCLNGDVQVNELRALLASTKTEFNI